MFFKSDIVVISSPKNDTKLTSQDSSILSPSANQNFWPHQYHSPTNLDQKNHMLEAT